MKQATFDMLAELIDNMPVSAYIKDTDGKFLFVNKKKAQNYDKEPRDLIGKTDFDLMPQDEAEKAWEDDVKVMTTGEPIIDKIESKDDGNKWSSATKTPRRDNDGSIIGIMGISVDVTTRIQMEKLNLKMLGAATHEIGSPLTSIAAVVKLLTRESFGPIEKSSKVELEGIYSRLLSLRSTVSDYLSKSALLVNGKIPEKQILDLRVDIIDPVLEKFTDAINKKGMKIDSSLGSIPAGTIKFSAVKNWITMAVSELLKNAIKHGGSENNPRIAFGYECLKDSINIIVYDNGEALSEEYHERIFQRFERVSDDSDLDESTGLGLYFVRDVIRQHGGDVWYEVTDEHHSKFVLRIPKNLEEREG